MMDKFFRIFLVLMALSLTGCAVFDPIFNQIGFNVKNPVYNDSNAANSKYNRNTIFGALDRRTPEGNKQYLALSDGSKYHMKPNMKKFDSNASIKKNDFWKKVYGNKPQVITPRKENIQPTSEVHYPGEDETDDPSPPLEQKGWRSWNFLKNTKVQPEKSETQPKAESDVVQIDQSDEKVIKTIEFIDHNKNK